MNDDSTISDTPRTDAVTNPFLFAPGDNVPASFARSLERENNLLRSALVELRRWVGDGDCSDDAGCVGFQSTAYRDVIAQADAAIFSNAEVADPKDSAH